MAKSIKIRNTRVGVARQKRSDGRGRKTSVYTYRSTGKGSGKRAKR